MRQKLEIYNYDRRIETILERISNSPIDPISKAQIVDFYRESLARGLSKARVFKYLYTLKNLAKFLEKSFEKATKDDIAELVRKIEGEAYAEWTKHDYKVIIKVFYRFLRQTDEYPDEVKWIRATIKHNKMLPEELLTEDDVKKLAERATTLRDKAFILVLYESGCRVGEILSLRVRNVQFDNYGAVLIVSGKTGDRRVRIIASAPKLSSWLDNHPLRENIDSPLWVTLGTRARNKPFSYGAAKAMLKDTAKRAEIKKRIYPHLFRHSRATFLAKHLTESQLKQHFGWVQASEMASTYVHLSGRDVDNSLLKLQGIKVDSQVNEAVLKTVSCQRCNENNSPDSKFCMRCGSPLDMETALKLDETRAKVDELINRLTENPDKLEKLLTLLG